MDLEASAEVSVSLNFGLGVSASAGIALTTPSLAARQDPYLAFRFAVEIEGLVAGGFSEVDGLQVQIEVQEYREGGLNEYMIRRAGPAKYPSNLSLKRGLTGTTLSDWCWDVAQGMVDRKNISVLLLDENGDEQVRWNFEQAYPVKWAGSPLRALANEVAVETVEFAHNGFTRVE